MRFTVVGGNGYQTKGHGAEISGSIPVTPGQAFYLIAGGYGTINYGGTSEYGSGGNTIQGSGGGGGASALRRGTDLIAVAGGGGGGGDSVSAHPTPEPPEGSPSEWQTENFSGDGGLNGTQGTNYYDVEPGGDWHVSYKTRIGGGMGATGTAPGAGGVASGEHEAMVNGNPGVGTKGGDGVTARAGDSGRASGAGGGGYFGGGSGAGLYWVYFYNTAYWIVHGAEGGGGSSYINPIVSDSNAGVHAYGPGFVAVSYA